MTESSSYKESIKFYERMSHLQGELKTYESQHFQLEEECQRLWTQRVASVSSSNLGMEPKTTTFTQLGHLSNKSQLVPTASNSNANTNLTNLNLNCYSENTVDEGRRRARNQAILDKLQELETNASIFAARSERLRIMKNEYENLVRKYPSAKKMASNYQSGSTKIEAGQNKTILKSTGVNTDISGPINPISNSNNMLVNSAQTSCLNIDIPQTHEMLSETNRPGNNPFQIRSSSDLISISQPENKPLNPYSSSSSYLLKNVPSFPDISSEEVPIRKPTFLDISSSSNESESNLKDQQNQRGVDRADETSADTTSLSVLMPKFLDSNYKLNVSSDGSLSDSQTPLEKERLRMSSQVSVGESSATGRKPQSNGKCFISSSQSEKEYIDQKQDQDAEEDSAANDGTTQHSLMDSIYNQTPDSLPRDDSELMHISEVDEDEYPASNEDQQGPVGGANGKVVNRRESSSAFINEVDTQRQENCDNSSSFNVFATRREIAQKEMQVESEHENEDIHKRVDDAPRQYHQSSTTESQSSFRDVTQDADNLNVTSTTISRDGQPRPQTENQAPQIPWPSDPLSKSFHDKIKPQQMEISSKEMAVEDSHKNEINKPLKKENQTNNNGKIVEESESEHKQPVFSSRKKAATPQTTKMKLKLDYDDSESEHSEERKKPFGSAEGDKGHTTIADKTKRQTEDLDDEFADFFD